MTWIRTYSGVEFSLTPWIKTYSGVEFSLTDPKPNDVRIEDIAHGLALACRFNGQCSEFYSVAQHSVLGASLIGDLLGPSLYTKLAQRAFLLHDAAEAYTGDIASPFKILLNYMSSQGVTDLEANIMKAVHSAFGVYVDPATCALVKHCDRVMLATEWYRFMTPCLSVTSKLPELHEYLHIGSWDPLTAERIWLSKWRVSQ